jgi:ketosteroid isomerase-like protein
MSQENVEAFKRATEATNRRDVEAVLEEADPALEFHAAVQEMIGGEAAVYRGHEGYREWFRDIDQAFAELHLEYSEIRDLGDRIVAIGRIRGRGRVSEVQVESPLGVVVDFRNGKAVRLWSTIDPKEALEAAGLRE